MKFSSVFILLLFLGFHNQLSAQDSAKPKKIEKCEFTVKGVCAMCETRIEKAAMIKGVKMVEWDKDSQIMKVIYAGKKVKQEDIHKAIAEAGHDTDLEKADDDAYATLPDCCAYRDGVKVH